MSTPRWGTRWGPVLAWAGVILIGTSLPGSPNSKPWIPNFDKVEHFGVYFVLGVLTWRALLAPRARSKVLAAGASIGVFGMLDELHQLFIPYREASVFDWTADMLGASLGLIAATHLLSKFRARQDLTT